MINSSSGCKIVLHSDPKIKRVGSGPLWAAIAVGLAFSLLWILAGSVVIIYNFYWAVVMIAASVAFGTLLIHVGYTLVRDGKRKLTLELTSTEAVLIVKDELNNRQATQMVLLDDVIYGEYYPYRDSATIILHTSYAKMEIPLWPMGSRAQDALDFLDGWGINIVNVQSDDPVPDMVSKSVSSD